jgi:uncharacterized SAM-binding protein YcdF (DUF218 family)
MFTCFVFSAFVGLFVIYTRHSDNAVLYAVLAVPAALFILLLSFGAYLLIALLFWNARAVRKRESRGLANCLTLILAVALTASAAVSWLARGAMAAEQIRRMLFFPNFIMFYYTVHVSQFLFSTLLCNLPRPTRDKQYVVILGCGLSDGKVTPLLAGRVDRAARFYFAQKQRGTPPKLVCSGGQGADEPRPEAEAMAEYALALGIPPRDILTETKSASTRENMLFSKEIMDGDAKGKPYRCLYATSNYHLLRAGIYARRAGLAADGIGAKTPLYYLPNAVLREYIAYLVLYRKWNIAFCAAVLLCGAALSPLTG